MFQLKDCCITTFVIQSDSKLGTVVILKTDDDKALQLHSEEYLSRSDYEYVLRVLNQENEDDPDDWEEVVDQIKTYFKEHSYIYVSD